MGEDDYFLEEEEEEEEDVSKSELNTTLSAECESSEGSLCPGVPGGVTMSRPIKKSTAFHDAATLEEQVGPDGMVFLIFPFNFQQQTEAF